MNVSLSLQIEELIQRLIRERGYASVEDVVTTAVTELFCMPQESLTAEDWAAIEEADAGFDRGEGVDIDVVRAQFGIKARVNKQSDAQ